jgi:hypothetical protein
MGSPTTRAWPPPHATTSARWAAVLAVALWLSATAAVAQSEWQVDVLIPDTISVRMPSQEIAFGLTYDDYPPPAFPARYAATLPEGGVFPVEVYATAESGWSLWLEIPDLVDVNGLRVIRADQVLYRVDGGVWTRASPLPQMIHAAVGPTGDWVRLNLEFQLELLGTERPGSFSVTTRLTAMSDGQAP